MEAKRQAEKGKRLQLYRSYRAGELPDVQAVSPAAFEGPLGALAAADAGCASALLDSLARLVAEEVGARARGLRRRRALVTAAEWAAEEGSEARPGADEPPLRRRRRRARAGAQGASGAGAAAQAARGARGVLRLGAGAEPACLCAGAAGECCGGAAPKRWGLVLLLHPCSCAVAHNPARLPAARRRPVCRRWRSRTGASTRPPMPSRRRQLWQAAGRRLRCSWSSRCCTRTGLKGRPSIGAPLGAQGTRSRSKTGSARRLPLLPAVPAPLPGQRCCQPCQALLCCRRPRRSSRRPPPAAGACHLQPAPAICSRRSPPAAGARHLLLRPRPPAGTPAWRSSIRAWTRRSWRRWCGCATWRAAPAGAPAARSSPAARLSPAACPGPAASACCCTERLSSAAAPPRLPSQPPRHPRRPAGPARARAGALRAPAGRGGRRGGRGRGCGAAGRRHAQPRRGGLLVGGPDGLPAGARRGGLCRVRLAARALPALPRQPRAGPGAPGRCRTACPRRCWAAGT
jgi:hypothetical protein